MNKLIALSLFLFSTSSVSAQYDTLHTEVLNLTLDSMVPSEFYQISIGLKDYYDWSGKTYKKKAQRYIVSVDTCQKQFFNHLALQGIEVRNIFTTHESVVPASWKFPSYTSRQITFEVSTKTDAKHVFDSFLNKGVDRIIITSAMSDSMKKQITTALEEKALKDCIKKAMSSVVSQGYDSLIIYHVQHFYNYMYQNYGQTTAQYCKTQSIDYSDIPLTTTVQINYRVLRKTRSTDVEKVE